MDLVSVGLVLIVVGLVLWAVVTYIPMQAQIKQILIIVVVAGVVLWLLKLLGLIDLLRAIKIGK